jgi:hypothetical protein
MHLVGKIRLELPSEPQYFEMQERVSWRHCSVRAVWPVAGIDEFDAKTA